VSENLNKTVVLAGRGAQPASPLGSQPPPAQSAPPRGPSGTGGGGLGQTRATMRASAHPLVEPMYQACADLLTLAAQLGQGASPPPSSELRRHLQSLFAAMNAKARAWGISPEDASDASFAIVALLDEILVQTSWPGKLEWQSSPLQFVYFNENTAGESFFRRAHFLLGQPHRAHVLQIYFYCLALGFQGRYAVGALGGGPGGMPGMPGPHAHAGGGAGLAAAYDQIAAALSPHILPSETLSPHGEPPDAGRSFFQREAPIVKVSLGIFALAIVAFVVLRISLTSQLAGATAPMREYAATPAPRGGP
jgi:type VI secretion system protein ImpK